MEPARRPGLWYRIHNDQDVSGKEIALIVLVLSLLTGPGVAILVSAFS
jgi:hypothetical protein